MISHLKMIDKDPVLKAKLVRDINALQQMLEEYSKRKTIYEVYLNHVHPVGRRMFKEEKFRKQIEEALNNDLYVKAAEFEVKS